MNAKRDGNHTPTLIASSSSDGITPILVQVNSSTNSLKVSDANTGSDKGNKLVLDDNRIPVLIAVSSADGITPIPVYADSSGNLLIQST